MAAHVVHIVDRSSGSSLLAVVKAVLNSLSSLIAVDDCSRRIKVLEAGLILIRA